MIPMGQSAQDIIDEQPLVVTLTGRDNDFLYPNFYWEIKPRARYTLQHQERFFFWQVEDLAQQVECPDIEALPNVSEKEGNTKKAKLDTKKLAMTFALEVTEQCTVE